jgi:polyhydroxyalkanoate synthesis regulator phasin
MDNKELVKQMIDLHKTSFGNFFSTMVTLQDQAEKMMKTFVDRNPGITEEGKKVMEQLNSMYKKNRDDFKKAVDEGYEKVEAFFDGNATATFQDQAKKMFDLFSYQKNWMPFDVMKHMEELSAMYKKGYDEFNKQIDENIQRMGEFASVAKKPQTKTR